MKTKTLLKQLKNIEMSKEMQARIIQNSYQKTEELEMNKKKARNMFKKPMVAVASLALCLCLTGMGVLAATGSLQGFFKDIKGWNGAVTGTVYEQATEEVQMSLTTQSDGLSVELSMLEPDSAPYFTFDSFGIHHYEILDKNGAIVADCSAAATAQVANGTVNIKLPFQPEIPGSYTLIVTELVGSSKADQPLILKGSWKCSFTE